MQLFNRYYFALVSALILLVISASQSTGAPAGASFTHSSIVWPWGNDSVHSPRKAAILSAVLPGAGQAYNRKYWKMPVVYAAGGAGAYFIITNNQDYQLFKQAYIYRNDDDPNTIDDFPFATSQRLKVYRDHYRRNLELSVILSAAVYILQIIDATVDAHLYEFDVSNTLSMRFEPALLMNVPAASLTPGLKLSFSYRSRFNTPKTLRGEGLQQYPMGLTAGFIQSSK
ncbi:MAG: DUF5683 domain-containing protein [Bacteroidales bacterium]